MQKPYFPHKSQDPKPLNQMIERKTRFDEMDPLNIMWHGHYASFFEEARVALGVKYSIGYEDFRKHGISIPLRILHIDYLAPLEFNRTYQVEAFLHWNEAARLDFSFNIYDEKQIKTSGYSVHLMIDEKKGILVSKPLFFEEFCKRWKEGGL
jgi:acyl-CoA thioester hydrolase